jgi:hypothetical protein
MKTYHWNGEYWYKRDWSLLKRIRTWLIWIGGWEIANGAGWKLFRKTGNHWRLCDPTPISLFGHRFTYYGWGWHLRTHLGYLTYSRAGRPKPIMYLSPDGTPGRATIWYLNPPHEIIMSTKL